MVGYRQDFIAYGLVAPVWFTENSPSGGSLSVLTHGRQWRARAHDFLRLHVHDGLRLDMELSVSVQSNGQHHGVVLGTRADGSGAMLGKGQVRLGWMGSEDGELVAVDLVKSERMGKREQKQLSEVDRIRRRMRMRETKRKKRQRTG
jgi:hypothetical protein